METETETVFRRLLEIDKAQNGLISVLQQRVEHLEKLVADLGRYCLKKGS